MSKALLACTDCDFAGTLDEYESAGFDDNTGAFVLCPKCCAWRSTAWAKTTAEESDGEEPQPQPRQSMFEAFESP